MRCAALFAVVHVTDDRFTLGSFDWDKGDEDWWASSFVESLPPVRPSAVRNARSR